MVIGREHYIQDEVEYTDIPFIVEVYDTEMYINGKSGDVRGVNIHGAPKGMKRGGRNWIVCECLVAKIRPDYPYPANKEYSGVDKHVKIVEPYEIPNKGILFYSKEDRKVSLEPMELAEKAADKLKKRFEEYEPPEDVSPDIIGKS